MKPVYKITADEKDISDTIAKRFVSLVIKDSVGMENDSMTLVLSDADESLVFPRKGVTLKVWLGYQNSQYDEATLTYKGSFIVDELDYTWPPNELSIAAVSTDETTIGAEKRSRQFSEISLESLVETIAIEHSLIPAVSESLKDITIDEYQVDESDMNYLLRLAKRFKSIAKVKNGRLLFIRRGIAQSASGVDLPVVTVAKNETSKGNYSERRAEEFDGTVATYWEEYYKTYSFSLFKSSYRLKFKRKSYYQIGHGQYIHRVDGILANKTEAVKAAELLYESLATSASTLSLTMDQGDPTLIAESAIVLTGFINKISSTDWSIDTVTHSLLSTGGLKTVLKLERLILT